MVTAVATLYQIVSGRNRASRRRAHHAVAVDAAEWRGCRVTFNSSMNEEI
jgi:hypothetical protein